MRQNSIQIKLMMAQTFCKVLMVCVLLLFMPVSCDDMYDVEHTSELPTGSEGTQLYILSEGMFNLNNSTLSRYSFTGQSFEQDFFRSVNRRGLGDTGNDMALYGSKLYVVVNVSSQVEVIDVTTGVSLEQISLFNEQRIARQPRYITFCENKAYVSCFDGYVARIDTATLQIDALVACGRNPEGLCVANGKLYVANSGGLDYPNYDHTVSVVDLTSFTETKKIEVGMNPGHLEADSQGDVYVVARGDYEDVPYKFQKINTQTDELAATYDDIQALNFTIFDDLAYIYNYDYTTQDCWIKVFDCNSEQIVNERFIQDGTTLQTPYGINVNPENGDVYITDAYDFTIWGDVLCFTSEGRLRFRLTNVGLNPNTVVFTHGVSGGLSDTSDSTVHSSYINRVLEYVPAPGQFMNTITSAYRSGFTLDSVLAKVNEIVVQSPDKGKFVTLGAWGGYIVVGFDHTIRNVADAYDFAVYGNAYSGNAEPGIVMVSADDNANGLADDTWYELAGSEYTNAAVVHDYEVTYFRPAADTDSVAWTDNKGNSGKLGRNSFHTQNYYPAWMPDQYTLMGARLPGNATKTGENWTLTAYDWGYADNQPNGSDGAKFKIEWAVDVNGKAVNLEGIDFVKIYTAMQQDCGWIGETSTEFCNVEDLNN